MLERGIVLILLGLVSVAAGNDAMAQNSGIGINKVITLKPGQSETLFQGVDISPIEDLLQVDLPPTVHVHRAYFSKAETIQGPIVEGGRYIVVARHPILNKTVYVDAMLPEGAPRIRYEPRRIVYIYPKEHIHIEFTRPKINGNQGAKLVYGKGRGLTDRLQTAKSNAVEKIEFRTSRSRIWNSSRTNISEARRFLAGSAEIITVFGEKLDSGLREGINKLPGVERVKSYADTRLAERERSAADFSAYDRLIRNRDLPIRTIK